MNEFLFLVGRVLFGGYFIMNAINHLTKTKMLIGYAQSKGVRRAKAAVIGSGALLLVGGLGILLGIYVSFAAFALVLFLLPVSYRMHAFWKESGDARMAEAVNFFKNMALVGAVLIVGSIPEPWPLSF